MKKLAPPLVLALALLLFLPAAATASTMTNAQLTKAVIALQGKVRTLQGKVKTLEARQLLTGAAAPEATLGKISNVYLDTSALVLYGPKSTTGWGIGTSLAGPAGPQGAKGDTGATGLQGPAGPDPAKDPAYAGLFAIAPYVSLNVNAMNGVIGPHIVFQGANVHVRSTSHENDNSGLGNLIVGWDDAPTSPPATFRTGSNNLVVGGLNNFTSSGGFVAGFSNTTSGLYASVSGGDSGIASGTYASVSGGYGNIASGQEASVSGGAGNMAGSSSASVSGGQNNVASGAYASVSGGYANAAGGTWASVSGGGSNSAAAGWASVGGGYSNTVSAIYANVSGGSNLLMDALFGWAGGAYHTP